MKNYFNFSKILVLISIVSFTLCDVINIEDILWRSSGVSFNGIDSQPFLVNTCQMNLKIHFNPVITVDPIDSVLHIDFKSLNDYANDKLEFLKQSSSFDKCKLNSFVKFSEGFTRIHLNLNKKWNGGLFVKNINVVEGKDGGWVVQIRFEERNGHKETQTLIMNVEFEKMRSKDEIDQLVNYLKSLN